LITIGIDPHKQSLTAAALDPRSRQLTQLRVPATSQAAHQLLAWAAGWPQRRWAVEGATGLGRSIAQLLLACWSPPARPSSTCRPSWPPAPAC
jgi:transposase